MRAHELIEALAAGASLRSLLDESKSKVLAAIKSAGATIDVEESREYLCISMWTPAGKVWATHGAHSITIEWDPHMDFTNDSIRAAKAKTWKAAWDDVRCGTEPCEISDCDTCMGY
jgi:hypothetical protein